MKLVTEKQFEKNTLKRQYSEIKERLTKTFDLREVPYDEVIKYITNLWRIERKLISLCGAYWFSE